MGSASRFHALEFFAGGGLARLGLASGFDVIWANDNDPIKIETYRKNFGPDALVDADIASLRADDLPGLADLAWASFPCQDLSLAGARFGLNAPRSGTFFAFASLIASLKSRGAAPPILVIENVRGLLSASGGADFKALLEALSELGYRCGVLEIDALHFVPQSRPRIFIVCVGAEYAVPPSMQGPSPFRTNAVVHACERLPQSLRATLVDWALPAPLKAAEPLSDHLDPEACCWWSETKLQTLLGQLSASHRGKVDALRPNGHVHIGTVYRRIRMEGCQKVQRAEVRFDGVAGCLRTPAGGSSRQVLLFIKGDETRARLLTAREAMALMGAPPHFHLPKAATAGLKVAGDGVVVPVVAHLTQHLLKPLAAAIRLQRTSELV